MLLSLLSHVPAHLLVRNVHQFLEQMGKCNFGEEQLVDGQSFDPVALFKNVGTRIVGRPACSFKGCITKFFNFSG